MSNPVPFYILETLMAACGVKPTDNVQKIEIMPAGILLTCAYTVETDEGWRTFTVDDGDGEEAVLTYQKFLKIDRPEPAEEESEHAHVHEDGESHTHEEKELVASDG
jgi:hypothetical protein